MSEDHEIERKRRKLEVWFSTLLDDVKMISPLNKIKFLQILLDLSRKYHSGEDQIDVVELSDSDNEMEFEKKYTPPCSSQLLPSMPQGACQQASLPVQIDPQLLAFLQATNTIQLPDVSAVSGFSQEVPKANSAPQFEGACGGTPISNQTSSHCSNSSPQAAITADGARFATNIQVTPGFAPISNQCQSMAPYGSSSSTNQIPLPFVAPQSRIASNLQLSHGYIPILNQFLPLRGTTTISSSQQFNMQNNSVPKIVIPPQPSTSTAVAQNHPSASQAAIGTQNNTIDTSNPVLPESKGPIDHVPTDSKQDMPQTPVSAQGTSQQSIEKNGKL